MLRGRTRAVVLGSIVSGIGLVGCGEQGRACEVGDAAAQVTLVDESDDLVREGTWTCSVSPEPASEASVLLDCEGQLFTLYVEMPSGTPDLPESIVLEAKNPGAFTHQPALYIRLRDSQGLVFAWAGGLFSPETLSDWLGELDVSRGPPCESDADPCLDGRPFNTTFKNSLDELVLGEGAVGTLGDLSLVVDQARERHCEDSPADYLRVLVRRE